MALYHVSFHTLGGRPVFEQPEYDTAMRLLLGEVLARRCILCPAWELLHLLAWPSVPGHKQSPGSEPRGTDQVRKLLLGDLDIHARHGKEADKADNHHT
jgi:hypothetical protein